MKILINVTKYCSLGLVLIVSVHFGYQDVILKNHSMNLLWSTIIGLVSGSFGIATTVAAQNLVSK